MPFAELLRNGHCLFCSLHAVLFMYSVMNVTFKKGLKYLCNIINIFPVTFDQFNAEVGNIDPGGPLSSVARLDGRFPAQKLTKTRPKTAQNFSCQNNVI